MKKYLVTGGAGFIGSNFLNVMSSRCKEDYFVCLDSLTYAGNLKNLNEIKDRPNFKFIKDDIRNFEALENIFKEENFDYVINFAAESDVTRSINNPKIFYETNVLGTMNLLLLSKKYNVKRFHQVSTDEVYGDTSLDSDYLFKETDILKPSSPYSSSKASADLLCLSFVRTFDLDVTISRCSNNYGPYQNKEKLIPNLLSKIIKNDKLELFKDGKNIRDWLSVYDHIDAIDKIIHHGKKGEIYNISANKELSNIEITNLMLNYLQKDNEIVFINDRLGHDLRYGLDATKIKEELDWHPHVFFEEGLFDTINWYLNNKDYLK